MMRHARAIIAALLFSSATLVVAAARASAQVSAAHTNNVTKVSWGAIDGSVRDVNGASLRGVEIISVDKSAISTRSGAGGAFRVDSIPAGPHLIRFRRLGILPLTVSVVVDANATTSVDAVVEPFPIALSGITIQAVSGELVHLPPGVADRMRTGIGTYLTADQIEKFHAVRTTDIFRHVAGVSVAKVGHEYVVRSARGVQTINGNACTTGMAVAVDGVLLSGTLAPGAPANLAAATGSLETISPQDIAAIEIYKDGAETPASLTDSECGVIYVWTR
ncbi:MAG: TonB-dependent receptor [Gemmatimonadaceae bacterium]